MGRPPGPRNERIDLFQKLEQELERDRPGGFGKLRLPRFGEAGLPMPGPPATPELCARVFRDVYQAEVDGEDRWSNDGRAALSWDATYVLSDAVHEALKRSDDPSRAAVQDHLDDGD